MLRKEDEKPSRVVIQWNPQGSRGRGRPRNSWRKSTLREAGRSWNELRLLSANQEK
jgi:hypothetical protein